jgi:hypothetical protein
VFCSVRVLRTSLVAILGSSSKPATCSEQVQLPLALMCPLAQKPICMLNCSEVNWGAFVLLSSLSLYRLSCATCMAMSARRLACMVHSVTITSGLVAWLVTAYTKCRGTPCILVRCFAIERSYRCDRLDFTMAPIAAVWSPDIASGAGYVPDRPAMQVQATS